jgi:hypothetical protein
MQYTILDAKAATGTGITVLVEDFKNIGLTFATASSANLTIKIQQSDSDTSPDFSAAQSSTNQWDYVDIIDNQNGSSIDGDTGISVAGTDDVRQFEINNNGAKWLSATVTARSAGSVTLTCNLRNNQ